MKKNILKFLLLFTSLFVLLIFYLSVIGLNTEKFNNQIKDKVSKRNDNLKIELKKIKLTLDPFNFKINAKTIGANIVFKGKNLELEYIKTQISLISFIKNRFVSSSVKFSTKSVLLKKLIAFVRITTNKPELFILEKSIKKGQAIVDAEINFDENGKIMQNYKINGILKDGKIELLKNYNFEKINFDLFINNDILNFKDISFTTGKTNFTSNNLKISKNKKDLHFEGEVQNKRSTLNKEVLNLLKFDSKNLNLLITDYSSKNKFSFNIDNKYKIKNLIIESDIQIIDSEYQKPNLFNVYFPEINDLIYIKNHKIKATYKKDNLTVEGFGKIKLDKEFDKIEYKFTNNKGDLNLVSNITLSELKLKKQEFLKPFFPKLNEIINLKNQKIEINYHKDDLTIKGLGEIKLEKNFDNLNYYFLKKGNKFYFDTQINLNKTSVEIDFLNFKKNDKLETELKITGDYINDNNLNFKKISILDQDNKIILKNLLLNKNNKIITIDELDLNYFDTENKKNQFLILRKKKNDYQINGLTYNANKLINNLLKSKSKNDSKIFTNNINLNLNLREVYIDEANLINNLKGHLKIKNNKVHDSNILANFNNEKILTISIKTDNNERVTTLYSSNAKPFVKRYKFIKGFDGGDLNFYSTKKDNISDSVLKIDNFKVQEVPALAKLLSLASLQGVVDLLTGEGIRFTDFEMNFSNNNDLMTINELYAIGPSISVLMDGYIQSDDLISLRGTLVPATTINRTIATIPLVGNLLIGKKVGEGVFGVSFKIKGPPKDLKTTVNPVKTLTPRFITRTLEKIKKN